MVQYSNNCIAKVLNYIQRIPRDLGFVDKIDFIYEEHIAKLKLSESDLRNILSILERNGYISLEGYMDGTFITFIR